MIDSILFDLDGTLWNSIRSILPCWQRTAWEKAGVKLTYEDLASIMGKRHQEIGDQFFPHLPPEQRLALTLECCREECVGLDQVGGELYDGVDATLRLLAKSYPMAIVSNCTEGYIEAFLKAHHFENCFVDFEHPGRTGLSKGENIRLVMQRQGMQHGIYVGDTQGDCQAARQAGIPFIHAQYGFGRVDPQLCDGLLPVFSDLPRVLEKWSR